MLIEINIQQLSYLVELDQNEHKLKEIATLFINAVNDWDSYNQLKIAEFIEEFENYFGKPITKDKIINKKIDLSNNNAWKHESGSSIIEMIELSELYYKQSNFDKIVKGIITYYQDQLTKLSNL